MLNKYSKKDLRIDKFGVTTRSIIIYEALA